MFLVIPTSVIISIITITISFTSLIVAFWNVKSNKDRNSYLALDNQYNALLNKGMTNPQLRNPLMTCNYDKIENEEYFYQYSTYAYTVWNFLETIYDMASCHPKAKLTQTWKPVLFEENKLHYRWFLKNRRLFRPGFQKYVLEELNQLVLEEGHIDDFKKIYDKMNEEFASEVKNKNQMIQLLLRNKYKLYLVRFKERMENDDDYIGYVFLYKDNLSQFAFLDYMHIFNIYQNCGYGAVVLKIIERDILGKTGLGIIFEIEGASDGIKGVKSRLNKFYRNKGALKIECNYQMPTADNGQMPMDLLLIPTPKTVAVEGELLRKFIYEAIMIIHSDYPHTESVIKGYINQIHDLKTTPEINIVKGSIADLEYVNYYMDIDFPENIQAKKDHIKKLIANDFYDLYLARNTFGEIVGYSFVATSEAGNFLFIDYLAINNFFREQGYGKMFMDYLCKKANEKSTYGIICEIPNYKNERNRRFLDSTGAIPLEAEYFFPSEEGRIPMQLVLYPNDKINYIPREEIKKFVKEKLKQLHGDALKKNTTYIRNVKSFERHIH